MFKLLAKGFGTVIGPIVGIVSDHLEGKRKIKLAKVESEVAIIQKRTDHEIHWEVQAQINSGSSWKDEYWTFVFSLPLIALFFPQTADHAAQGFATMRDVAPEWYIVLIVSIVLTSFGIRPNKEWLSSVKNWKRTK